MGQSNVRATPMYRRLFSFALIVLVTLSPMSSANALNGENSRWSYECHHVDRRAAVGELTPQLTYERTADNGSPSYAITVYHQGFVERTGEPVYLWARVIIYNGVANPGCWRARIREDSFKEIQARLSLEKEMSQGEAMSIVSLMDTSTEVATLVGPNGEVRRFMGSAIGIQTLRAVVEENAASEIANRIGE